MESQNLCRWSRQHHEWATTTTMLYYCKLKHSSHAEITSNATHTLIYHLKWLSIVNYGVGEQGLNLSCDVGTCERERTLRVSETSGLEKWSASPHTGDAAPVHASIGRHLLHLGIDFRSYDSESTRSPENSGAPGVPGVPGVAGADAAVGVPVSFSGIAQIQYKGRVIFFFWFFLGVGM